MYINKNTALKVNIWLKIYQLRIKHILSYILIIIAVENIKYFKIFLINFSFNVKTRKYKNVYN